MKRITFLVALLVATVSLTAQNINFAEGKTVTVNKGSKENFITDGSLTLGDYYQAPWEATQGCGSANHLPEFTVDLGSVQTISSFNIVFYWGGSRIYKYEIYTSTDGNTFTLSSDQSGNTQNSVQAGLNSTPTAGTESARYVKVVTLSYNGNSSAGTDTHVIEFRVYDATNNNLAANKTVTTPSCHSSGSTREPQIITDGTISTSQYWDGHFAVEHPATEHPQATIDLGKVVEDINQIKVFTYWGGNRYYQYYVEISEDGSTWEKVMDRESNTTNSTSQGDSETIANKDARYVRITGTYGSANADFHIVEMQVFAPEVTTDIVNKELNNLKVSVSNGMISVADVETFEVFNVTGKQMNIRQPLQAGIYLVKANNLVQKVIVK